jgi:AsmA protein
MTGDKVVHCVNSTPDIPKEVCMSKIFKLIFGFVLTLIFLAIVAFVVLAVLVKPNHLKPIVSQQVQNLTGKTLTFQGDLSWKFFPTLGFGFQRAEFGKEKSFNNLSLITADKAVIGVKVKPLFSKKIEVSELSVGNLVFNFVKNKKGVTNWQTLKISKGNRNTDPKDPPVDKKSQKISKLNFELTVPKIEANRIAINWINLGNGAKNKFIAQNLTFQKLIFKIF